MESFNTSLRLILDIQKGTGFNFLRQSIIVSCSLANHTLETDPIQANHSPVFESKLIWETEKNTFHKLCEQNVPVKIEIKSRGQKQQIGYILLSLLSAKPCTLYSNNKNDYSWHKLLGVKFEGKTSNPQLLLNLIFDECVDISICPILAHFNPDEKKNELMSQNPKPNLLTNGIIPRICLSTQTIEIGDDDECTNYFILQLQIMKYEHFNLLNPFITNNEGMSSDDYFTILIFSQILKIEKRENDQNLIRLNIKSNLSILSEYFKANPNAVIKFRNKNSNIGVCSFNIQKIIPTIELDNFLNNFCNNSNTFSYVEKCYMVNTKTGDIPIDSKGNKPCIDMEVKLQYINESNKDIPILQMKSGKIMNNTTENKSTEILHSETSYRNISNIEIDNEPIDGLIFSNNLSKSYEFKNEENGKNSLNTDIDAIIEKINSLDSGNSELQSFDTKTIHKNGIQNQTSNIKTLSKNSDTLKKMSIFPIQNDEKISSNEDNINLSPKTMENLMMQMVNELEDWKECQQELFKSELKEKEEKHLIDLKKEWNICRKNHETKLCDSTSQCQNLVQHLREITENLKRREIQLSEREQKLCLAKDEFEIYYRKKYSELKDAAKQMELDYQHQLKLHKFEYSKLEMDNLYLKQENSSLKEKKQ